MKQGTDEWFEARLGKVTASRIADVMSKTKTGYGAARAKYKNEVIAERLSGTVLDRFVTPAMRWGIETEPAARSVYEMRTGNMVREVGFIQHPFIRNAGASPDGIIGNEGGLEIKCPQTTTHIDTLLTGSSVSTYILQMQWQLACTGLKWCDFVSYDPRLPDEIAIYIRRVDRDEALISEITEEVSKFLLEVDQAIEIIYNKAKM